MISGMGELHLEIIVDRLLREFKVSGGSWQTQRSLPRNDNQTCNREGRYVRQSGGRGQYGHVVLEVEPREPGSGLNLKIRSSAAWCPGSIIPSVERGAREALEKGMLAKYPVVDVEVRLVDGSYHDVDSSDRAFSHRRFHGGCKEGLRKGDSMSRSSRS